MTATGTNHGHGQTGGGATGAAIGTALHRVTFGFNVALLGAMAGGLLSLAAGTVAYRRGVAEPSLMHLLGLWGGVLAGALGGAVLGTVAAVRALRRHALTPRPLGPALVRAGLIGGVGTAGAAVGGALTAVAALGFQEVWLPPTILLAVLCALLGACAAGYVGFGWPADRRTLVLALVGGLVGGVPGCVPHVGAGAGLLQAAVAGAGLVGGLSAGLLVDVGTRRARPVSS